MTSQGRVKQGFALGGSMAGAFILLVVGIISMLQGIAAIASDELFVVGAEYVFEFDTTVWGWIHVVVGVLVAIIAVALFGGATWAKIAAIVIACASIVANFVWLPFQPGWAILIIFLDVVVIWALATWDTEV